MSEYEKRLADYFCSKGQEYLELGGTIWTAYQRMIIPEGPACRDYSISLNQQKTLLSHFKKALLLRYTDGFHPSIENPPWYAITCHKFLDLGECSANTRSKIRRGLKNCTVQKVDAEYIAAHGYDVFMAAFAKYRGTRAPNISKNDWQRQVLTGKGFSDILHFWAVWVDKELVAYSTNRVYRPTEVAYLLNKFHPAFMKAYPAYALFFTMNEYYLRERSFEYIVDGYRNISHATNVQEFLIHNFGFVQTPTNLFVRYRPLVSAMLSVPAFARRWISRFSHKYASLCIMDQARCRSS